MASSETAVRDAATKLHAAILTAQEEGYRVDWPSAAAGLLAIAISETGNMKQPELARPITPSRPAAKPFGSES